MVSVCSSSQGDDSNEDCWFRIRRHRHHDVLRSCIGDMLLIQQQMKRTRHARHKIHMKSRKRRSWHIDPTDPLGSEFSDVRAINNEIRQPQYGSNISKQTIALVEDPLQVLLSESPRSPTQEKNRKNRKIPFWLDCYYVSWYCIETDCLTVQNTSVYNYFIRFPKHCNLYDIVH